MDLTNEDRKWLAGMHITDPSPAPGPTRRHMLSELACSGWPMRRTWRFDCEFQDPGGKWLGLEEAYAALVERWTERAAAIESGIRTRSQPELVAALEAAGWDVVSIQDVPVIAFCGETILPFADACREVLHV